MKVLSTEQNPEGVDIDTVFGLLIENLQTRQEMLRTAPLEKDEDPTRRRIKSTTNRRQLQLLAGLQQEQKKLNTTLNPGA